MGVELQSVIFLGRETSFIHHPLLFRLAQEYRIDITGLQINYEILEKLLQDLPAYHPWSQQGFELAITDHWSDTPVFLFGWKLATVDQEDETTHFTEIELHELNSKSRVFSELFDISARLYIYQEAA